PAAPSAHIAFAALAWVAATFTAAAQAPEARSFHVEHYAVTLEVDLEQRAVRGIEMVRVAATPRTPVTLELDAGTLEIDAVREGPTRERSFAKRGAKVFIDLPDSPGSKRRVEIRYHGSPQRGVKFLPESMQVSTAFATSQWL